MCMYGGLIEIGSPKSIKTGGLFSKEAVNL